MNEYVDDKTQYYLKFKSLVHMLIRPIPILVTVFLTFYNIISFINGRNYTSSYSLTFAITNLNLWIGVITALLVYDNAQKKYLVISVSNKKSYIWPIVVPILWLLFCWVAWFVALPLYLMYKKSRG